MSIRNFISAAALGVGAWALTACPVDKPPKHQSALPPIACGSDATKCDPLPVCAASRACVAGQCVYTQATTAACPCIVGDVRRCDVAGEATGSNRGTQNCILNGPTATQWGACAAPTAPCGENERRCSGDTPQVCSGGAWVSSTACAPGACTNGACNTCAPVTHLAWKSTAPELKHTCGFQCTPAQGCKDDPARGSEWMGTRTGNDNPCVTQAGPDVRLPQGNYKVTFDLWPRGKGVQALVSVLRGGRPVLPPDGPGEVAIPATDGRSTEYAYNFRVTANCSEPYEFVVKYLDAGGSPPGGYVQSWATRLDYQP